jgi:hypothetical protein
MISQEIQLATGFAVRTHSQKRAISPCMKPDFRVFETLDGNGVYFTLGKEDRG